MTIDLQFHGATESVTGSCHQISYNNESLLIDCGTFQGKEKRTNNELSINFDISKIRGLVLTHAHLDHIGRLPYLLAAGYVGPIYASIPTAYLILEQLEDALKIGFTTNHRLVQNVISEIRKRTVPCKYKQWIVVSDKFRIKFQPAGHILGSAFVEIDVVSSKGKRRIVFSGDLGAPYTPILSSPCSPYFSDILVLESTYGNRIHKGRKDRRNVLLKILRESIVDKGMVIIPAFAIGRTQELLYELNSIIESKKLPALPVIVDSPLATKFVKLYSDFKLFWDKESKRRLKRDDDPFLFPGIVSIKEHREHLRILRQLSKKGGPAIIIAGSGMCTGGRVTSYLKRFLPDHKSDIIFIGYQASGTLGRKILTCKSYDKKGKNNIEIDGKQININAGVHEISGYSAHADQGNLVRWVKGIRKKPERCFLVHGEMESKRVLKKEVNVIGLDVVIAKSNKKYKI